MSSEYIHFYAKGLSKAGPEARPATAEGHVVTGCDGTQYRQTPAGEPTVRDLVPLGSLVENVYGDFRNRGVVVSVTPHMFCPCPHDFLEPFDRRKHDGPYCHPIETFSVGLADEDTAAGKRRYRGRGVNELVAVGGRVLRLFMANQDETVVIRKGPGR